jgi:hypothetical protein
MKEKRQRASEQRRRCRIRTAGDIEQKRGTPKEGERGKRSQAREASL